VGPSLGLAGLEHLVQVGCLGSEHVDAFVQRGVTGGRRHSGVPGQGGHAGVFTEPAQHQDRLGAAGGGAGANAGAPAQPFGGQRLHQQRGGFVGQVQGGRVGEHAGSPTGIDSLSRTTSSTTAPPRKGPSG
jgi:hypothetical protein